jgi:hypothetical protein
MARGSFGVAKLTLGYLLNIFENNRSEIRYRIGRLWGLSPIFFMKVTLSDAAAVS